MLILIKCSLGVPSKDFLLKSIKVVLLLAEVCAERVQGCGMGGSTEKKWTPDGADGGGDAR